MNEEKVLKLPNSPMEKNKTNSDEELTELIWDEVDKKKPRRKEETILINKTMKFLLIFNLFSFL